MMHLHIMLYTHWTPLVPITTLYRPTTSQPHEPATPTALTSPALFTTSRGIDTDRWIFSGGSRPKLWHSLTTPELPVFRRLARQSDGISSIRRSVSADAGLLSIRLESCQWMNDIQHAQPINWIGSANIAPMPTSVRSRVSVNVQASVNYVKSPNLSVWLLLAIGYIQNSKSQCKYTSSVWTLSEKLLRSKVGIPLWFSTSYICSWIFGWLNPGPS